MTGAGYRWTASAALFLGGVATLLSAAMVFSHDLTRCEPMLPVVQISSIVGVGLSALSQFLYADQPDRESPLNHQAATLVAVGLNTWPWALALTSVLWAFGK
jgi:hypothetical protein